jgi:hypothetical protein
MMSKSLYAGVSLAVLFYAMEASAQTATGLPSDTPYAGSGNGTVIAVLKGIYAVANGSVPAGLNLIGKVGIDQTTPGTTNAVAATNLPTTVDTNTGNASASTPRVVIATNQPNLTTPLNVAGTVQPGNTPNTTPWLANSTSQYPSGATAVTGSATGTTAATTASLPAVASNYNFVCGYSIRANATAAATVTDTLTGVITGTMSSELWVAPNASGLGVDEQIFSPCIPSSAVNTAISAVSGAPGTGGVVSVHIWGYYKTTTP